MGSVEELVAEYIELRDKRADLRQHFESQDKLLRAQQIDIEKQLLTYLQTIGAESIRTKHGTVFVKSKVFGNIRDWRVFMEYIIKHKLFDLVSSRIKSTSLKNYIDETGSVPPGIDVVYLYEAHIHRA